MTRRRAVLASALSGAAVLATTPAVWVRATARTVLADDAVAVTGLRAAPAVSAAGLLLLAAALAMTIARRRGAVVAALAVVAAGVLVVGSAWSVLASPEVAAAAGATAVTGVGALEGRARVTVAAWLALLAGGGTTAIGGWAVVASRRWAPVRFGADAPSRAERAPSGGGPASWDALTRGEDPTD